MMDKVQKKEHYVS